MHWNKFSQACHDLEARQNAPGTDKAVSDLYSLAADLLKYSQRFYLPDSANVLSGRTIDAEVKSHMKLPFPVISVLSEEPLENLPKWRITLAFDPSLISAGVNKNEIALLSISYNDNWFLNPPAICLFVPDNTELGFGVAIPNPASDYGKMVAAFRETVSKEYKPFQLEKSFYKDCFALANLCALLAVHDCQTPRVPVPEKLAKARIKRGKSPLHDYRVLKIGGTVWDSPYDQSTKGEGSGKRSHLRRGHIRRLENKLTWVRHTFVHGQRPGFVQKDYHVERPQP